MPSEIRKIIDRIVLILTYFLGQHGDDSSLKEVKDAVKIKQKVNSNPKYRKRIRDKFD